MSLLLEADVFGEDDGLGPPAIYDVGAEAEQAIEDREEERQERIAAGIEHVCVGCGCSDSRACPGGCFWATANLCSRCALGGLV